MVAERRALREARGAARVLDVDRVVEVELGLRARAARRRRRRRRRAGARPTGRLEQHDPLERRERGARPRSSPRSPMAEAARRDEDPAAGLRRACSSSRGPVGGVDVDEDRADPGGRELDQHPLSAVGSPDPDTVAGGDAPREQRACELVDALAQFAVAPAHVLVEHHERVAVAGARRRPARGSRRSSRRAAGGRRRRVRRSASARRSPLSGRRRRARATRAARASARRPGAGSRGSAARAGGRSPAPRRAPSPRGARP